MYSKVVNMFHLYIYIYACNLPTVPPTDLATCFSSTSHGHCSQLISCAEPRHVRASNGMLLCRPLVEVRTWRNRATTCALQIQGTALFYEESPSCQNIRSACMRMCFSRMFWQSMKDSCEDLMPAKRFSLAFWIGYAQGCLVHCQILNSLRYLTFCWPGTWFVSDMYSY